MSGFCNIEIKNACLKKFFRQVFFHSLKPSNILLLLPARAVGVLAAGEVDAQLFQFTV